MDDARELLPQERIIALVRFCFSHIPRGDGATPMDVEAIIRAAIKEQAALSAENVAPAPGFVSVPVEGLLAIRDALTEHDEGEAYHRLYTLVTWNNPYEPWAEWVALLAAREGK